MTTAQIVEEILNRSPFVQELMYEGLINISSLARNIKDEVENRIGKEVKKGAIVMAINRIDLAKNYKFQNKLNKYIINLGDLTVKTQLSLYTYVNTQSFFNNKLSFLKAIQKLEDNFCTYCQGVTEQTMLIQGELELVLEKFFTEETLVSKIIALSAISIKLPKNSTEIAGIYYFILKVLAWENIPLVEVLSTTNEITLILKDEYVERAFSLLMKMKRER